MLAAENEAPAVVMLCEIARLKSRLLAEGAKLVIAYDGVRNFKGKLVYSILDICRQTSSALFHSHCVLLPGIVSTNPCYPRRDVGDSETRSRAIL